MSILDPGILNPGSHMKIHSNALLYFKVYIFHTPERCLEESMLIFLLVLCNSPYCSLHPTPTLHFSELRLYLKAAASPYTYKVYRVTDVKL